MSYGIIEIDDLFDNLKLDMDETASSLQHKYLSIRAGRANPHLLDGITVDYYGVPTPLNNISNISVAEARVLTISVWDANALKGVEKAILAANIGITPNNDGKIIRLIFPELTEERRKSLVKEIKLYSDNGVIGLRNIRRDAIESLKKMKKDNLLTEDDLKDMTKDVDNMLSVYIRKLENLFEEKEKEIMSV